MGTVILIVSLGAALNLALWGALFHRVGTIPRSVWKIAQRSRTEDESRALDVLQAAAASRLGGLVIGVQTYHEQLAGLVRARVAEAEVRARTTERCAADAGIALDAASALVRDLRTLAEDLASLIDYRAMQTEIAAGEAGPRENVREERDTIEMPRGARVPETLRNPDRQAPTSRQRPLTAPPEPQLPPAPVERDTVEMPHGARAPETLGKPDRSARASRRRPLTTPPEPADEERVSGDEDLTRVQNHPLPGTRALASAGVASSAQGGAR